MNLEIRAGTFAYGHTTILHHLSFSLTSGEILAVLGPNGIGKTTLLKCLAGIYPWQAGGTYLDGKLLAKNPCFISYVPQAHGLSFPYTVQELVMMGRARHIGMFSIPQKKDFQAVENALRVVGIAKLAARQITTLSGGQLQMAFIAQALAGEPKILVLDEPESHLDFRNQSILLKLIVHLAKEQEIACMMNTHYPDHALRIADKALLFYPNGKYSFGKAQDVITEKNLATSFGIEAKLLSFVHQGKNYPAFVAM